MSEVTIKGVTWCRVDGGWWCTSASRLANGYDADTALDEVVRLREENARLRTAIEKALGLVEAGADEYVAGDIEDILRAALGGES